MQEISAKDLPPWALALGHIMTGNVQTIAVQNNEQGDLLGVSLFFHCGHEVTIASGDDKPLVVTMVKGEPLAQPQD